MPPETHKGQESSYPADIWAFGCVLFELTNLKMAYTAPNGMLYAVILKVIQIEHQEFERESRFIDLSINKGWASEKDRSMMEKRSE